MAHLDKQQIEKFLSSIDFQAVTKEGLVLLSQDSIGKAARAALEAEIKLSVVGLTSDDQKGHLIVALGENEPKEVASLLDAPKDFWVEEAKKNTDLSGAVMAVLMRRS